MISVRIWVIMAKSVPDIRLKTRAEPVTRADHGGDEHGCHLRSLALFYNAASGFQVTLKAPRHTCYDPLRLRSQLSDSLNPRFALLIVPIYRENALFQASLFAIGWTALKTNAESFVELQP